MADLGGRSVEDIMLAVRTNREEFKADIEDMLKTAEEGVEEVGEEIDESTKSLDKFGVAIGLVVGGIALKAFDALVKVIGKAANAAFNFVVGGLEMNATLQTLEISFISLTGSQENAAAVMDSIRKKAIALGQDYVSLATVARRLIPFSQGDVDVLDEILTLSQQLAVLNPVAGLEGAGRVLADVLAGGAGTNFQRVFDVNRQVLNELTAEFRKTGDIEAFVASLQELVGAAGITAESIEEFAATMPGSVARITAAVENIQRVVAIPIAQVLSVMLGEVADAFAEEGEDLEVVAIKIGAFIGAVLLSITDFVKSTVRVFTLAATLIEVLANKVTDIMAGFISTFISSAIDSLNVVVNAINSMMNLIPGLEQEPINPIQFDKDAFERDVKEGLTKAANLVTGGPLVAALKALEGEGLIFPEFGQRFSDLVESGMEELNRGAEATLGQQEAVQTDLLEGWEEFYLELRDIFEKHDSNLEKERDRHLQKLEDLDTKFQQKMQDVAVKSNRKRSDLERKFAEDVGDARRDLQDKLQDIDRDLVRKREDIMRDRAEREVQIEQDSAARIRSIRASLERDLFDAINARDARRVFELMRQSSQARREETIARKERLDELNKGIEERLRTLAIERQRRRADAKRDFDNQIADLQRNFQRRMAAIQRQLQQEIADANIALQRQREMAQEAHKRRMDDLENQLRERLAIVARGWAEEGTITEEALAAIGLMLEKMFGVDGLAVTLLEGFVTGMKTPIKAVAKTAEVEMSGVTDVLKGSAVAVSGILQEVSSQAINQLGAVESFTGNLLEKLHAKVQQFIQAPTTTSAFAGTATDAGAAFAASQAAGGQLVWDPNVGAFVQAAQGFDGMVTKPTLFLAGEGNRPEQVTITPQGGVGGGGAAGGDVGGTLRIFVQADRNFSREFEASLSEQISRFVGGAVSGRRRTRRG